jgi:transposase-like protein
MITADMRAQMRRLVLADNWRIETVARRFGVHHSVVRRAIRTARDFHASLHLVRGHALPNSLRGSAPPLHQPRRGLGHNSLRGSAPPLHQPRRGLGVPVLFNAQD